MVAICGRIIKRTVVLSGVLGLLALVLAFTSLPFHVHRWLALAGGELLGPADHIIVLGGSAMPSGGELMRVYKAAELGHASAASMIWLVHTGDTATLCAMQEELRLRGIPACRVQRVIGGGNTREQALNMWDRMGQERTGSLALVSVPEHMYRALATFRKVGFSRIQGAPALEQALFVPLSYAHRGIGGRAMMPDVSNNLSLRYDLWNNLKLELTCLREIFALGYYKMNGWLLT